MVFEKAQSFTEKGIERDATWGVININVWQSCGFESNLVSVKCIIKLINLEIQVVF